MSYPTKPSKIGCDGYIRDPDGNSYHFKIIDEVQHTQTCMPQKFFCLQRLQFDNGTEEFRLGYYIIGKKPRVKGKWVWGQYCPFLPKEDFEAIIAKAIERGWISTAKPAVGI